jgi:peptidoglycan/xylan/chitin deacetylase (PgdA/CDA1 family)
MADMSRAHSRPSHADLDPPWQPSPQLWVAALVHAASLLILIFHPTLWRWSLGTVAAYNLLILAATLWPRSQLLGPNLIRLPPTSAARGEIALTFDDGPDPEVTPAVLNLLDAYDAKATFFFIADKALAHSSLCREIVRRGHAVENHSTSHRHTFALLGPRGYTRELETSQQQLTQASGVRPKFFRAPAGFRNPLLWPSLARHRLTLASWTRRGFDTRSGKPDAVLRRLLRGLAAGDILLLHDGHAALTAAGHPVVLDALPALLTAIHQSGLTPVTLRAALSDVDTTIEHHMTENHSATLASSVRCALPPSSTS